MDTLELSLGETIRTVRETRGLSRRILGGMADVSDKTIQRYEEGATKPDTDVLKRLASALGVDTHDLLSGRAAEQAKTDRPGPTLSSDPAYAGTCDLYGGSGQEPLKPSVPTEPQVEDVHDRRVEVAASREAENQLSVPAIVITLAGRELLRIDLCAQSGGGGPVELAFDVGTLSAAARRVDDDADVAEGVDGT